MELSPKTNNIANLPFTTTTVTPPQTPTQPRSKRLAFEALSISTLRLTPAGSKFTEHLHSSPTNTTIPTVTRLPRLRRHFAHRNPRTSTAACNTAAGRHRTDAGIAIYRGECAAGTVPAFESGNIVPLDVFSRAGRDGLLGGRCCDRPQRREDGEKSVTAATITTATASAPATDDIVEQMREGLQERDWRSLACVLTRVAGALADWRFATFYGEYLEGNAVADGKRSSCSRKSSKNSVDSERRRGGSKRSGGRCRRSGPHLEPDMLLLDVQGVLDKVKWGRIAQKMEMEMLRWRRWEEWGCERVTVKSLQGAQVLRAVREASRTCGVPEAQLRRAIEAYAVYSTPTPRHDGGGEGCKKRWCVMTADRLARESKWEMLARILVEDLQYLDGEASYKNAARLMKKSMGNAVRECRDVYFDTCTMVLKGRVDWTLRPRSRSQSQSRRKTGAEAEAEAEAEARRGVGKEEEEEEDEAAEACRQESSGTRGGSLFMPERLSDATTVVAGSLKRRSRDLGAEMSGLFRRRSSDSEQQKEEEGEEGDKERERKTETEEEQRSRPDCQEAQHYPIFDHTNPAHLPSSHPLSR